MRNFGQGKQKGKGFSEITYQGSHPARQHLVPWGPKAPDCRPATDLDDLSEMLSTRNFVAFFFLLFLEPHPWHMEVPRPGISTTASAAGLHHCHSKAGSEPHLQPTPQLMATPDLQPTECGQGSNPHPHGY